MQAKTGLFTSQTKNDGLQKSQIKGRILEYWERCIAAVEALGHKFCCIWIDQQCYDIFKISFCHHPHHIISQSFVRSSDLLCCLTFTLFAN